MIMCFISSSYSIWLGQVGIAARYPRYKDEITSINGNITLKNEKKKTNLFFLTNTLEVNNYECHNCVIFYFFKKGSRYHRVIILLERACLHNRI